MIYLREEYCGQKHTENRHDDSIIGIADERDARCQSRNS
jgi:hypothetical protein